MLKAVNNFLTVLIILLITLASCSQKDKSVDYSKFTFELKEDTACEDLLTGKFYTESVEIERTLEKQRLVAKKSGKIKSYRIAHRFNPCTCILEDSVYPFNAFLFTIQQASPTGYSYSVQQVDKETGKLVNNTAHDFHYKKAN